MKIDGLDHPKTIDLADELGVCIPQAIGHLELLWYFTAQKTPRGNIGRWSDAVIANAAQWTGKGADFVAALVKVGYVDEHPEHRLIVHDWHEHLPRWVKAKLSRENKEVITPEYSPDSNDDCSSDCSPDDSPDSSSHSDPTLKSRQGKASQGKGSQDKPPDCVSPDVWSDFVQHRKDIKAPLKPTAYSRLKARLERMATEGQDVDACLIKSIESGWKGVFPEKPREVSASDWDAKLRDLERQAEA